MTDAQPNMTYILDTIAKLKSLAERPGSPEEAANATEKIQRLMLRYNLDQSTVDTASRNDQQGYDNTAYDIGATAGWRKQLINRIAMYTFCQAIFGEGRRVYIVGETHNVTVVTNLYEYLVGEIDRLADEGWKAADPAFQISTTARRWKHAFRTGAGHTITLRLKEQYDRHMAEQTAANNQTSAIVHVKAEDLADAVVKHHPFTQINFQRASSTDVHGHDAGVKAGQGINLVDQIEG